MLDKFYCWLAWKLPRGLAKWAFLRVAAHASGTKYSNEEITGLTTVQCLDGWDNKNQN